jgi:hypothetical protein
VTKRALAFVGAFAGWVVGLGLFLWKPGLATLGPYLVAALALLESVWHHYWTGPQMRRQDAALFDEFERDLPYQPDIAFLASTGVRQRFDRGHLLHLRAFDRIWVDAAHEFLDRGLERARSDLKAVTHRLVAVLDTYAWQRGDLETIMIPATESDAELRTRSAEVAKAAEAVVTAHQRLTRRAIKQRVTPTWQAMALLVAFLLSVVVPVSAEWVRDRHALEKANGSVDTLTTRLEHLKGVEFERDTLRAALGRRRNEAEDRYRKADNAPNITCSTDKTFYSGGVIIETSGKPIMDIRAEGRVFFEARPMNGSGRSALVRYEIMDYFPGTVTANHEAGTRYALEAGPHADVVGTMTATICDSMSAHGFTWGFIETRTVLRVSYENALDERDDQFFVRNALREDFDRVSRARWEGAVRTADSLRALGRVIRLRDVDASAVSQRVARDCLDAAVRAR